MFTKIILSAAAAAVALTAMPSAADARHRDHRYQQSYGDPYYQNQGYYGGNDTYYGRNQGYYDRGNNYYGNSYNNGRRCSGTTGTIVGGVAGALLGREITRSGSRYRRGGSGTTGTIIGGAIGALAGRAVAKSSCRNRY
jgi:hypothetical protein